MLGVAMEALMEEGEINRLTKYEILPRYAPKGDSKDGNPSPPGPNPMIGP
jgi:hypothetical protein